MSKFKNKRDFRDALGAAARLFAGDRGVMLGFGSKDATDAGKAIVIRDPELMMEHGIDEDLATTMAKASTTHEAAHIKHGTNIVAFNDAIIKLVRMGADKELAFSCINYAEDVRIDTAEGKDRPGYKDQRMRAARAFMPLLYKRTDTPYDMHLAVMATTYDVDLRWKFTPDEQDRIDKAVKLLKECETATGTATAAEIGTKVYTVLFGEPVRKPDAAPPSLPEPSLKPSFDEDDDDSYGDLDIEPEDDEAEEAESEGGEWEGDDTADDGEADGDGEESTEEREHEDITKAPEAADPADEYTLPGEPKPESSSEGELKKWLKDKEGEVLRGDSLAGGLSDKIVDRKERKDATAAKGEAKLAHAQKQEMDRGDQVEHTALSAEIETRYSKGINAGVQIWYTKPKIVEGWASGRSHLARARTVTASVADLTQAFKDLLRKARERDSFLHRNGTIRADKVWRGSALGDGRVFTKHEEKGAGGYAVKLLLDASGSMCYYASKAAVTAYVIAKALKAAGMAVCVESFDAGTGSCCVYHSILLPWNSQAVDNVLGYHDMAQNRDGYSIKAATYELLQRQEAHKILIVVSDGSPAHGGTSNAIRMAGGIPGGGGEELIDDAAQAVREARASGVKVLGVYFGAGSDTTEAYIYGKDYAHIQELERVAPVIRTYLSRIMSGV